MKKITFLLIARFSLVSFGQAENEGDIQINKTQQHDTYRARETSKVNAVIKEAISASLV